MIVTAEQTMLSVDQLSVWYGAVRAVNDVRVTVERGEAVAIIGSNGAGKTSMLRGVMGLEASTSTAVFFFDRSIGGLKTHSIAKLGIGYVPEGRELFGALTVEEELMIGGRRLRPSERTAMTDRVFELFPRLKERRKQLGGTMSGGEQQMLSIGRILMTDPKLLLLDEPSLGLAPVIQDIVYETLSALRDQGLSMLVVEQNAYRALRLCKRAYVLEGGCINFEADSQTLLADPNIKAAYLGASEC